MQPCAHIECSTWVAYGEYCAKHEPTPTVETKAKQRSGYKHANKELVRAIPAVDATEVRVTPRPRVSPVKPWSIVRGGTVGLTDCVVTRADGSQYIIPKNKRKRATSDEPRRTVSKVDTSTYADRLKKFGAVGNNADA